MEVLNQLRLSFRRSGCTGASSGVSNSDGSSSLNSSTDSNNSGHAVHSKKRGGGKQACDLCGKRLLKLPGWRNYFTLPCRCRHVFCKQCITGRLQCRQKVLRSASFDLMWTFPCPGSAQCHQQLTVDFSRGSSYSKNLVARDLESGDDDDSWEHDDDEEMDGGDNILQDESDVSVCEGQDESRLREIG